MQPTNSLVLASLDIGRVLADRDVITFRAQGTCMYPTIRPGDVLRIHSRAIADVAVGDIVVYRTPSSLFSHRVIRKGEHNGRAFIITRPDRSHEGSDVPTFDENLLGVVVSITRNGKPVPLQPAAYPWLLCRYHAVRLALIEVAPRARAYHWLANILRRVQSRALYRNIARWRLALTRPRITYTVRVPLRATDALYQQIPAAEFKPTNGAWQGCQLERWRLALHFNADKEPAALALFAPDGDGWQMQETQVRVRYRGMGLEDALMRQAEAIWKAGNG